MEISRGLPRPFGIGLKAVLLLAGGGDEVGEGRVRTGPPDDLRLSKLKKIILVVVDDRPGDRVDVHAEIALREVDRVLGGDVVRDERSARCPFDVDACGAVPVDAVADDPLAARRADVDAVVIVVVAGVVHDEVVRGRDTRDTVDLDPRIFIVVTEVSPKGVPTTPDVDPRRRSDVASSVEARLVA